MEEQRLYESSTTQHSASIHCLCVKRENQQDATIRCLLSTSVSTRFGHNYAHLQENKDRVTAYGVLLWFCFLLCKHYNPECLYPTVQHTL